MKYDFATLVDRENTGNMKEGLTPAEMARDGWIAFAGAEMDFQTAPVIVNALKAFAAKGIYGFSLADQRYLDAVRWWMRHARDFLVSADEIIPTLGTIFSVGTVIRAFTEPDDGVILLHPVYYRYDVRVRAAGRRVVSVPLIERNGVYKLNEQALEAQMALPENKLLIFCNPHNPLGKVFSLQELEVIHNLAEKYNVLVFSDEIFAEVVFNGHTVKPFVEIAPDHAITCTSLGKVFNLTGVNHANVIIKNRNLRDAFIHQRTTDHFGSIDPFFYNALVAGYSPDGLKWVEAMKAYVWENYIAMRTFLQNNLSAVQLSPLEGGFIVWMDFRALQMDDAKLTAFLEQEAKLVLDPGEEYGQQGIGFRRMNIASPRRYITAALDNLYSACKSAGLDMRKEPV